MGLLGRVYKQTYVNAVNKKAASAVGATPAEARARRARAHRGQLESAVLHYATVYRSNPEKHYWHGINAVACAMRARRDGLGVELMADAETVASDILTRLEKARKEDVPPWDWATALEACVALGNRPVAFDWLALYVGSPKADAFEIASTLRQMEEVWELTADRDPGDAILPVLRGELLKREGGQACVHSLSDEARALEAILADTRFQTLAWYRLGLQRCNAVAKIETAFGEAIGSGVLVRGGDFHPALKDEVLLLTNAHVVSDETSVLQAYPGVLRPEHARARFEVRGEGVDAGPYRVDRRVVWTSPPWLLDATLLRLEPVAMLDPPYPLAVSLPAIEKDRVYVIGHPGGGPLALSLEDNRVIDLLEPRVHYRAPTLPGSSGSPVFNSQWELVALHHAGSLTMKKLNGDGTHPANEGIWIAAIIKALASQLVVESGQPTRV